MTRLFGTNGIRWIIGSRSQDFPVRLGVCAGNFYGNDSNIAIGMDTRTSSPMIKNGVVSGLLSSGANAIDLGLVPTPLVQFAVKKMNLGGGLMITASHNPPEFNGLKFFAPDGTELSRADEENVEDLASMDTLPGAEWNCVGHHVSERHVQSEYRKAILSSMGRTERDTRVVIDCANGAGIEYTPDILTKAGCSIITLNSQPDGRFPGRMPEPVKENVGTLMSTVREHGAAFGAAHDGDADRATFVDERGEYISGDNSLAIFAIDAIERRGGGTVVVPINTSRAVEDAVTFRGGKIEYTAVGSPLIARRMMEVNAILGGEGNGGIIFPEHQLCRDGIMAAARMLDIYTRRGPLSNLVAELPGYWIKSEKLRYQPEMKEKIFELVRKGTEGNIVDIDGIKSIEADHWSLIRASGTEPIIRITVETDSEAKCDRILGDKMSFLKGIIQGLS